MVHGFMYIHHTVYVYIYIIHIPVKSPWNLSIDGRNGSL